MTISGRESISGMQRSGGTGPYTAEKSEESAVCKTLFPHFPDTECKVMSSTLISKRPLRVQNYKKGSLMIVSTENANQLLLHGYI